MKVPENVFCPQELSPYHLVPASQLCILSLSLCLESYLLLALSLFSVLPSDVNVPDNVSIYNLDNSASVANRADLSWGNSHKVLEREEGNPGNRFSILRLMLIKSSAAWWAGRA